MAFPRQVPHIPRLSEFHELREDVVYAHADGVPLRFDHYRPRKVEGPAPAVIFIHGGAWMHGDVREDVRAVIVHYGPFDLSRSRPFPDGIDPTAELLGPRSAEPAWVRLASPTEHAANATAPVLVIHGTADTIVSYRQSVRMHEALVAAGKAAELLLLEGAPHAFQIDWRGEANRRANEAMDAFLERHLRTEP